MVVMNVTMPIYNIQEFLRDTNNSRDINVDVNFYKKSGYYNKFFVADGWWNCGAYYVDCVGNIIWRGDHWYGENQLFS